MTIKEKIYYYQQPRLFRRKIEELEECEEKTVWMLHHDEHLRDCDTCLIFKYWGDVNKFGFDPIETHKLHNLTPAETITRCRRHIQNKLGLYLPTDDDVIKARGISEEAVKEWSQHET